MSFYEFNGVKNIVNTAHILKCISSPSLMTATWYWYVFESEFLKICNELTHHDRDTEWWLEWWWVYSLLVPFRRLSQSFWMGWYHRYTLPHSSLSATEKSSQAFPPDFLVLLSLKLADSAVRHRSSSALPCAMSFLLYHNCTLGGTLTFPRKTGLGRSTPPHQ